MNRKKTNHPQVDKTPLSKATEANHLYELSFSRSGRIKVVPSPEAVAFILLFIAFAAPVFFHAWNQESGSPSIFLNVVGLIFATIPLFLLLRRRPLFKLEYGDIFCSSERIRQEEVLALQVVQLNFYKKRRIHSCWEANLVLQDLSRRHIYVSGNKRIFDAAMQQLAERLHLPVWENDDMWKPDDEATLRRHEKNKGTLVPSLCFSFLILVVPVCLLFFCVVFPACLSLRSRSWQRYPAVVTFSEVKEKWESGNRGGGHWTYKVDIRAKYLHDGKSHLCERYDYFLSWRFSQFTKRKELEKLVQEHPVGSETTCLVNPKRPWEAVITNRIPLMSIVPPILWAMPFLMIGIAPLAGTFRIIRLRRKASK